MRLGPTRWNRPVKLGLDRRVGLGLPREFGLRAFGEVVRHVGARDLERRFGASVVQRLVMAGMVRSFVPEAAEGFRGQISLELTRPQTGGEASWWTIEVGESGASAHAGRPADGRAALSARVPMADFLRLVGGAIDPAEPLLAGRATLSGDLGVAARLAEMFGAPRPR